MIPTRVYRCSAGHNCHSVTANSKIKWITRNHCLLYSNSNLGLTYCFSVLWLLADPLSAFQGVNMLCTGTNTAGGEWSPLTSCVDKSGCGNSSQNDSFPIFVFWWFLSPTLFCWCQRRQDVGLRLRKDEPGQWLTLGFTHYTNKLLDMSPPREEKSGLTIPPAIWCMSVENQTMI